ncbi:formate dehydrogenase accessory sulfurtransferase FdhD [Thalassomonas viridans]|uniref:Sulfur carrier protein FdhD n=1 Tax=Thalassomonas viridans TaxID=137584 RepID=A0AAF0C790_9GAMM|nr:formate dehydrogenase accessory sulfurtransferase FdhD [Thalassomonas viridans]WDE05052.1 formate dehydrogenase accessory sulfurtransferase FdhD [Thalassomonas viridans]
MNNTDQDRENNLPLQQVNRVIRTRKGADSVRQDTVIIEEAVALVYNGISHAVMMATPQDLLDFALGFSLSEGIIGKAADLLDFEVHRRENGIEVSLTISSRQFARLKQQRRTLAGVSGCGLCGVESLEQTHKQPVALAKAPLVDFLSVEQAVAGFHSQQVLNRQSGGVHGAAFYHDNGELALLREDVGRHNALDKLIGALAQSELAPGQGFVLASSRASYEMVYKTIACGINHLVTFSAPTSKAIALAQAGNLNLIGFAREGRQVVYHSASIKCLFC